MGAEYSLPEYPLQRSWALFRDPHTWFSYLPKDLIVHYLEKYLDHQHYPGLGGEERWIPPVLVKEIDCSCRNLVVLQNGNFLLTSLTGHIYHHDPRTGHSQEFSSPNPQMTSFDYKSSTDILYLSGQSLSDGYYIEQISTVQIKEEFLARRRPCSERTIEQMMEETLQEQQRPLRLHLINWLRSNLLVLSHHSRVAFIHGLPPGYSSDRYHYYGGFLFILTMRSLQIYRCIQ